MAAMTSIERLDSLAAELASLLVLLSLSSTTSPTSSPSSHFQIKEEVEKLRRRMRQIRALVVNAEEREKRDGRIKFWLDELRDVAYGAEDVLEEHVYGLLWYKLVCEEEANQQITHEERGTRRSQVSDSPHITCPYPDLRDASFQEEILAQIRKINHQFDEMLKDGQYALTLTEEERERQSAETVMHRPPSGSLLGYSHVYGRDDDKEKVVDMLLPWQHHEPCTENVSVVSIVGMGGIGKTALAQLVYNDERVRYHFGVKSWLCVSDSCFDVIKLTKEILEAIKGGKVELQGFNLLQEEIQHTLKGKRFLLVLDDLWNDNWQQWESLCKPLLYGAEGSKVLVTTRDVEVSRVSRAIGTHHLEGLLSHDCWSLFARCAFGCKNPEDYPNLISIGKQIVQKCGGVPLAIRTLGGLLSDETDEDRWNDVLNSDMWNLPWEGNYSLAALTLSYHHLPSAIKPCFAACAVFPKDYLFEREKLIFFWMAQGYIIPGGRKPVEEVGHQYFDVLLQRSIFQVDHYGKHFRMHDLMHDLALSIWGNECFTIVDGKLPDVLRKVRHLSFNCEEDITSLFRGPREKFRYLRTFFSLDTKVHALSDKVLGDMFRTMTCLRVLDLACTRISGLPDSIGNLKHLRCLIINGGRGFNRFPESLCHLLNLQTLRVQRADYLEELPKRLKDLVNLRHLDLAHNRCLSMMPQGIGGLTQLRTLRRFVVGEDSYAAGMGELRHLNHLQGELTIDIRSLNNWGVDREAKILDNKRGLEILIVEWNDHYISNDESRFDSVMQKEKQHEDMLELIQPHTNIKQLHLSDFIGSRLPTWMGDPSYSGLHTIALYNFKHFMCLAALGRLPLLKFLKVSSMHATRVYDGEDFLQIGTEEGGAFPSLRALKVMCCDGLKLVKLRYLSALRTLSIQQCRNLTILDYCYDHPTTSRSSLPRLQQQGAVHIPCVHTMWLEDCPKLDFLPAEPQLQVPTSLRKLYLYGSPLLKEWAEGRIHKLAGVTNLLMDRYQSPTMGRPHLVLRNIEDMEEAEAAKLGESEEIDTEKLEFRWELDQHLSSSSSPEEAEQVLERLGLSHLFLLRELVIEGYRGRSFPNWVGHPHYLPNLRKLTIRNCPNLTSFQVHVLQVPQYGAPFSPSSSSPIPHSMKSLPCLELLVIQDCPKLVSFSGIHGISSLRHLVLRHCPVLDFPPNVPLPPKLECAEITGCPLLRRLRSHMSHLLTLQIDGETIVNVTHTSTAMTLDWNPFSWAPKALVKGSLTHLRNMVRGRARETTFGDAIASQLYQQNANTRR